MARYPASLCWFRRDLRLDDHAALAGALEASDRVYCVFVFDRAILDDLPSRRDRRVEFIHRSVGALHEALLARGSGLIVLHARAADAVPQLAVELGVAAVFTNRDYEPAAIRRDEAVAAALGAVGIAFHASKDQVIFERDEVLSGAGTPYTVFTPYRNNWLKRLGPADLAPHPGLDPELAARLAPPPITCSRRPTLAELGFEPTNLAELPIQPGAAGAQAQLAEFRTRIDHYDVWRDFPGQRGPSYLSVHLRFGTLSIRQAMRAAVERDTPGARKWRDELIWREFYFAILHHFPYVAGSAFKREYADLPWPNRDDWFTAWCEGRTGYPLVDAAMRQLNQTGYMHNRLRMVAASFLTKDLLNDWRRGEAYFAAHLNDFDLAANNGGWQWSASTGCDAQPWFRIFNPVSQSEKFDADGHFIRRYVPELANLSNRDLHAPWRAAPNALADAGVALGNTYPHPIVDHAVQRLQVQALFKAAGGAPAGE